MASYRNNENQQDSGEALSCINVCAGGVDDRHTLGCEGKEHGEGNGEMRMASRYDQGRRHGIKYRCYKYKYD